MSYQSLFNIDNAGDVIFDPINGIPVDDDPVEFRAGGKKIKKATGGGGGAGDVVGPVASDSNSIATFDGATGKLIKDSGLYAISGVGSSTYWGSTAGATATGPLNVVVGLDAFRESATGGSNVVVGNFAMSNIINGTQNVAIGISALNQTTNSGANTAVGFGAGNSQTTGGINTFLGANSNVSVGNISNSTALGYNAIVSTNNTCQIGNDNVERLNIGSRATLKTPNLGASNFGYGNFGIFHSLVGGTDNIALGAAALQSIVSGSRNIGLGSAVGPNANGTTDSISIGHLCNGTGGNQSVAIGSNSQAHGINSMALGYQASNSNANSVQLGNSSVNKLSVGGNILYESFGAALSQSQAGFGSELNIDIAGVRNLFLGEQSGINVDSGNRNVAVGSLTIPLITSQNDNTAIGDRALEDCASSGNTAIGTFSGTGVLSLGNNTCLGSNTTCIYGQSTVIGHSAAASRGNQCMIGSSAMEEVVCNSAADCDLGTALNPWNQVHSKDKYYIDRFPVGRIYSNITPVTVNSNLIYTQLFTCPSNIVGNTTFCELGTIYRISERGTILSTGPQTGPIQFGFKLLCFGVELILDCDLPDNDLNPAQGYFYTAEICFTGNFGIAIFQELRIADEGQQGPFYGWKSEQVFAGVPANISSNIQLQGLTQNSGGNVNTMNHIFGYVERL